MVKNRSVVFLLLCAAGILHAQDSVKYSSQPIVVTATRIATDEHLVNRSVDVIDGSLLNNLALTSVEEVLQHTANVSVESRGAFGVQTDLSMRGTLFSQNTVLVNGVSINDPQTAHYNFNLPFSAEMIDRIEILRGPGSAQYGANALGGVVNVITKVPEGTSASLHLTGGENGLIGGEVVAQYADATVHSINSVSYKKSDGYHLDTDFLFQTITTANRIDFDAGQLSITGGYEKKDFGAFEFYTWPNPLQSREALQTGFADIAFSTQGSVLTLTPRISYRRNTDQFILTVLAPSFYTAETATDLFQGEIVAQTQLSEKVKLTAGISLSDDDIISNYEGDHTRTEGALFASIAALLQQWTFDASLRFDAHSDYGNVVCPSMSAGYLLGEQGKIYATVGKAFRAPSYTELYINDGFNIGNPGLQPEIGWSYELGGSYRVLSSMQITSAIFQNDQNNLIDYIQHDSSTSQWYAVNLENVTIRGAEVSLRWNNQESTSKGPAVKYVLLSYGYLDSQISHDSVYATKYSNNYPRHQIAGSVIGTLPLSLSGSVGVVYKIKAAGDSYALVDASLTERIRQAGISIRGTNLLNQSYEENAGVPMPGRWLWLTIDYELL